MKGLHFFLRGCHKGIRERYRAAVRIGFAGRSWSSVADTEVGGWGVGGMKYTALVFLDEIGYFMELESVLEEIRSGG
jgi:hypothetical protein